MKKIRVLILLLSGIVPFGDKACAAMKKIGVIDELYYQDPRTPRCSWSFSCETNTLLLDIAIDHVEGGGFKNRLLLYGEADSDTVLTVVETITNKTGVPWTDYYVDHGGAFQVGGSSFIYDSAKSTKLTTVTYHSGEATMWFSGSELVLPGDWFTIEFKIKAYTGPSFGANLYQWPVPEPSTVSLLGMGVLMMLKAARSKSHGS